MNIREEFQFANILTLISHGKFTEADMLLSMTLLLNSGRVPAFNRDTRKALLHQCVHLVRLIMAEKEYREGKKEYC
jgi:hypothetical protein